MRVPDVADEAMRDLVREDAVRECRNARRRLKALLLRKGIMYSGKSAWTAAHLRWLAALKLAHAAQQIGFQESLHAITEATARIARLEQALRDALPDWSLKPLVQAMQALRGVQMIAAMTLVAELQELGGWASLAMVQRYAHLGRSHVADWAGNMAGGTNPAQVVPAAGREKGPEGPVHEGKSVGWLMGYKTAT